MDPKFNDRASKRDGWMKHWKLALATAGVSIALYEFFVSGVVKARDVAAPKLAVTATAGDATVDEPGKTTSQTVTFTVENQGTAPVKISTFSVEISSASLESVTAVATGTARGHELQIGRVDLASPRWTLHPELNLVEVAGDGTLRAGQTKEEPVPLVVPFGLAVKIEFKVYPKKGENWEPQLVTLVLPGKSPRESSARVAPSGDIVPAMGSSHAAVDEDRAPRIDPPTALGGDQQSELSSQIEDNAVSSAGIGATETKPVSPTSINSEGSEPIADRNSSPIIYRGAFSRRSGSRLRCCTMKSYRSALPPGAQLPSPIPVNAN